VRIPADEPPSPVPPQPSEADMDVDREIEYALEREDTMGVRPAAGEVE
jgi:hypothetical protein